MPCTLQYVQGIWGLLVAYCTILESGGTVVCIGTTAMVAGLMVEMDENEFAPSFQGYVGGTST